MPLPQIPTNELLGKKRAAHLLRRATFGPTIQQIDTFANLTATNAINALYHQTLQEPLPPVDLKTGQEWVTAGVTAANSKDNQLCEYFKGWFISQMLNPSMEYSAREKIVFFLHTHFTAIQSKIDSSRALYFQNKLYRLFALDGGADPKISFKELAKKVSVDNAMIRLLDGNLNVKGSPNENYARELLELYTIGRGLENSLPPTPAPGDYGVYTESDVQTAARILSGWDHDSDFLNNDTDTNIPRGKVKGSATNASAHDNDATKPKTFSAHFGSTTITPDPLLLNGGNATEASALDEISQLIEMLFAQEETQKNICRKIYRFFVWAPHSPDEVPGVEAIINEMATTFKNNGYKIQAVIEELFKSQHFYEGGNGFPDDTFGGIIKSPLELTTNVLRFFNVQLPDMSTSTADFYMQTTFILDSLKDMAMDFFEPYDVSGYDAYHQYPIYHRSWITPNTLPRRYQLISKLLNADTPDIININVFDWVKANISDATASVPQELVKELVTYLFPVPDNLTFDDNNDDTNSGLTSQRLNYFRIILLQGGPPNGFDDAYWTNMLWPGGQPDLRLPLNDLFNSILQSPEFQLQ